MFGLLETRVTRVTIYITIGLLHVFVSAASGYSCGEPKGIIASISETDLIFIGKAGDWFPYRTEFEGEVYQTEALSFSVIEHIKR